MAVDGIRKKVFSVKKSWDKSHTEIVICGIKLKLKKKVKPLTEEEIYAIHSDYEKIVENIKNRKGEKIKVAFMVALTSMFPAKSLFEKMLKNDKFEVSLIIIPDFRFSEKKIIENYKNAISELAQYKSVTHIVPINEKEDNIDLKTLADIVFCPLPYDVSHEQYKLKNIIKKGILPALVNYGFYRSTYDRNLIANERCSLYWKIFTETELNEAEYKNYQKIKGKNTLLTGYCKMDSYRENMQAKQKKTIMISPHHSVEGGFNDELGLSNFYKYSNLFLKLPDMYPNINFIFRPHPALFALLSNSKYWGEEKVNEYLQNITSKPNVIYSTKGDYFEKFALSDGIINDCGSYLVEYFYTKKPHCYMLKSPDDIKEKFTSLGQQCLENCYVAYEENDIIDFIDNVILNGNDTKKEQREKFANDVVMYNYPNASEKVIEYFERELSVL